MKPPRGNKALPVGIGLVLPLLLLGVWELLSRQGDAFTYAFVPVSDVVKSLLELIREGDLLLHLGASLWTAIYGLLTGGTIGFLVGCAMAVSRPVDALLSPLYHALRQVPTMGFIPLIGLWFGSGTFSIHLLVSIATFEVLVLNTYEGLRGVEKRYLELGRALTFSQTQTFFRILLPSAFPSILTGILQAVAFAWIATIGAELLFTTGPGLGVIMERAQLAARMDSVIVCLIAIGLSGYIMNATCLALGRRILRWRNGL